MKFNKCEKAITKNDLVKVENELGIQLPEAFKLHYLQYNGGEPENSIWIDKTGNFKNIEVNSFISIFYRKDFKDDPGFSLPQRTKEEWEEGAVPKNLMPFADGDLIDYICLNYVDQKVYYFERDTESHNAILLSNSFQEFMEELEGDTKEKEMGDVIEHKFWGQVYKSWAGFSPDKTFTIPYFDQAEVEIFLGKDFDEGGEEIYVLPTQKQLTTYEKTFSAFLQNLDTLIVEIKQKAFEYYKTRYANYYEDKLKSGKEPLNIDTSERHFDELKNINYIRILKQNILQIPIHYGLDMEHGIEIKIKNNKVVDMAGIDET